MRKKLFLAVHNLVNISVLQLKIVACDAKANRPDSSVSANKVKKHFDIKKPVVENTTSQVDDDDSDSAEEPDLKRQKSSSTVFHNTPANNL